MCLEMPCRHGGTRLRRLHKHVCSNKDGRLMISYQICNKQMALSSSLDLAEINSLSISATSDSSSANPVLAPLKCI